MQVYELPVLALIILIYRSGCGAVEQPPGGRWQACMQREREALLLFKQALTLHHTPPSAPSVWDRNTSCCSWAGVACSTIHSKTATSAARVTGLSLPHFNLSGPIALPLFTLSFLHTLNLSFNQFSGSLPPQFTSLSRLRILDLSFNNFSGSISLLSFIPSLISINVSSNSFTNKLPSFQNLTNLQELHAQNNYFSGAIDPNICQYAPKLRALDLSANMLSGSLAGLGRVGSCVHLEEVVLAFNMIQGSIPQDLYSIRSLSTLSLASNQFSGDLHASIGNLTNLAYFSVGGNLLHGSLPKTLSKNSKLVTLNLSSNSFTGPLDVNFANHTFLEELLLGTNFFSGHIPKSIGSCLSLRHLNLKANNFSGAVPMQFNSLNSLVIASLGTNHLTGSLQALENCHSLVTLTMSRNIFTEPLPRTWNGSTNLQVFGVGLANIKGTIPLWLQRHKKLQVLDLSWNHLEGEIPIGLGQLPHLVFLDLSNNSLDGTIPQELFELPSLMVRNSNSGLAFTSPLVVTQKQMALPSLHYKEAEALPGSILLANNRLTGQIPSKIGHVLNLLVLDVSDNFLEGSIPSSLANITSLEKVDLSFNCLSGSIPTILTTLTFLSSFNVSFNNLSGLIPSGNQFSTFALSSYEGNVGLCLSLNISSCSTSTNDNWVVKNLPHSHAKSFGGFMYWGICIAIGVVTFSTTLLILATCKNKLCIIKW